MSERVRKAPLSPGILLVAILSAGCASLFQSYGSFVPDDAVRGSVEAFRTEPGMKYYFTGAESYPSAIIGVDGRYTLDEDFWKAIEPEGGAFKTLVQRMLGKTHETGHTQYGFVMKSPEGHRIGWWYAPLHVLRQFRLEGDRVIVHSPKLKVYEQREIPTRRLWE